MSLADINPVEKSGKKGSGLMGSIVGGIAGAVAGIAATVGSGGNAGAGLAAGLATTSALSGGGAALGGIAGEQIDPTESGSVSNPVPKSEGQRIPLKTISADHPEVQLAQMQHSKGLLQQSNVPNAGEYISQIDEASKNLKNRMGV